MANYLVREYGFMELHLTRTSSTPLVEKSASEARLSILENGEYPDGHSFSSVDLLLSHVTRYWDRRWVTTDIWDEEILETLLRRPFFILVSVDAPVILRWKRFIERLLNGNFDSIVFFQAHNLRCIAYEQTPPSLEQFVVRNDNHLYHPTTGLANLIDRAEVRLINSSSSLQILHEALDRLDLMNEQRLRPSWDQYFMQLASLAARRSNCMKRRVGCVLVREKRVISTGYNGTPRNLLNCNEGGCKLQTERTNVSTVTNGRRCQVQ